MNFIVAADEKWNIGLRGNLLTYVPEDLINFRLSTTGGVVVMGRKTLESFPGGKPLKNRTNVVLTRDKDYKPVGDVIICHSIDELMERLKNFDEDKVWLIGGGQLYNKLIPYCNKGYITILKGEYEADTTMLNMDEEPDWQKVKEGLWQTSKEGPIFKFTEYSNRR